MKKYKFIIDEESSNNRLDLYLQTEFPNLSRTKLQKAIKAGHVLVNDTIVKTGYMLKEEDIITYELIEDEVINTNIEPVNLNLDIIYEDDDLLVVNKPKNLVVHPAPTYNDVTLVHGLLYHTNKLSNVSGNTRPGIVHRLDKNTTGLMVIAKNDLSHELLSKAFSERTVLKKYYAICYGTFKNVTGTIDMPIKRDENNRLLMAVDPLGKESITEFTVLEKYPNYSLIDVDLKTGRTHQIRVHFAKIGHPILGDDLYGPKKVYGDNGQYLHAYYLSFVHPIKKEQMTFELPLPLEFKDVIKTLI